MFDHLSTNEKMKIYKSNKIQSFGVHLHDEYEFVFIEAGSAEITINGERKVYKKDTLIAITNLLHHTMQPVEMPYLRYIMLINPKYFEDFIAEPVLRSIFSVSSNEPINTFELSEEDAGMVRKELDAIILDSKNNKPYNDVIAMAALLKILVLLYRNYQHKFPDISRESEIIMPVKAYVDLHFSDDLNLDNISTNFFINKYHLTHLFKKVTGYSLKQYIILKRISYARELLCLSDKNITQIAGDCGFNSTSNFIRSFKSIEGETPLGFRKAFQKVKRTI